MKHDIIINFQTIEAIRVKIEMYSTAINTMNEQLKVFHNGLSQQNSKAIDKLKEKVTNARDTLLENELLLKEFILLYQLYDLTGSS